MSISLHGLIRTYVLIETSLNTRPLSEADKRQLEVLRDELGEEIVSAVRTKMRSEETTRQLKSVAYGKRQIKRALQC